MRYLECSTNINIIIHCDSHRLFTSAETKQEQLSEPLIEAYYKTIDNGYNGVIRVRFNDFPLKVSVPRLLLHVPEHVRRRLVDLLIVAELIEVDIVKCPAVCKV